MYTKNCLSASFLATLGAMHPALNKEYAISHSTDPATLYLEFFIG